MGLINPNKKYKKLITFGCSFTTGFNLGNDGSWGQHLSDLIGCLHVNKGGSQSNTKIVSDLISYCESHDMTDCCVGIQLSDHVRREYWDSTTNKYWVLPIEKLYGKFKNKEHIDFMDDNIPFYMSIWYDINENILRTINSIILMKSYLNQNNIDFIMFEGVHSIMDYTYNGDVMEYHQLDDTFKQSLLDDDTFFNTLGDWYTAMGSHPLHNTDKNFTHPSIGVVRWWVKEMYEYMKTKFS